MEVEEFNKILKNCKTDSQSCVTLYQFCTLKISTHLRFKYRFKNEADVEECIHNVFMKLYTKTIKAYVTNPVAWLYKVTDNHIADMKKKSKFTVELLDTAKYTDTYLESVENTSAIEALKEHEPVSSDVVVLKFYYGYSFVDIAKMLDMKTSTVRTKWRHAQIFLKDFYE